MKYIRLFEEYMNKIGSGIEHNVYEIDDDFVLKVPNGKRSIFTAADFKHHISYMKRYPEIFVNVKQLDKFRASIEKVDTKQAKKELDYIKKIWCNIEPDNFDIFDPISIYMHKSEDCIDLLDFYATENEDHIIQKWLDFFELLYETIYNDEVFAFDIHDGQFGIDKNGKIKLLDF